jgi:hypothetical protein
MKDVGQRKTAIAEIERGRGEWKVVMRERWRFESATTYGGIKDLYTRTMKLDNTWKSDELGRRERGRRLSNVVSECACFGGCSCPKGVGETRRRERGKKKSN